MNLPIVATLILSLLPSVTCRSKLFGGKSDYLDQISYNIIIGQMKQRILLAMNRSEPPNVSPVRTFKPDVQVNFPSLIYLLSQDADSQRQDVIFFKLGSFLSSHVLDIEQALLVFRVRSIHGHQLTDLRPPETVSEGIGNCRERKDSSHSRRRRSSRNRRTLVDSYNVSNMETGTESNRSAGTLLYFGKGDSIYNLTAHRGQQDIDRDHVTHETCASKHVKIVVRVMNMTTGRKRNIAVQEIEVKRTTTVTVSVPRKYLMRAAVDIPSTLTIQIVCRRCGQWTWVESVHKSRRRHGTKLNWKHDRSRLISPNRPYLFLEMRNSSTCAGSAWNYLVQSFQ